MESWEKQKINLKDKIKHCNRNGLISRLETAEERISELEDSTIEFPQTEKQREERLKEKNKISKTETTEKDVTYV